MHNIGVYDGLIDPKHEEAMGPAIWLFLWCIRCQPKNTNFVLGGKPLTYEEIEKRSGFPARRVRRWLTTLRRHNYLRVTYLNYKMLRIEIMKSKKWAPKQPELNFGASHRPQTVEGYRPQTVEGASKNGQSKQMCNIRNIESKEEEGTSAATAAAFSDIGFEQPFGPKEFQREWAEQRATVKNGEFTDAMERTIQNCNAKHIKVPGQFFTLKHAVEKMEIENRFKRTPL